MVHLPGRERGVRRPGAGGAGRAAGRARLGTRLPPDAGPPAHPRAAARAADRVLPARTLAAVGHLRPAAVAGADPGRAAGGGRGVLPHRGVPQQLRRGLRAAAVRLGHPGARDGDPLPDGRLVETLAAPISIDAAEFIRHASAPETDAEVAALVEQFAAAPCCSGSTASTTPRASWNGCWPWRCCWSAPPSTGPAWPSCRSPCPAGTTCGSTASCVPPSSRTSGGSTGGSPSPATTYPCTTCTGA